MYSMLKHKLKVRLWSESWMLLVPHGDELVELEELGLSRYSSLNMSVRF